MDIKSLDLNLLRLFDTIYRLRNISRAAEALGLSQPATSQALTRLRLAMNDPLFQRAPGGVKPTARADRLARTVQEGLALLEAGLEEEADFDPRTSSAELRLHLTDIGEARFLPRLMEALGQRAPLVKVHAQTWAPEAIPAGLEEGKLHYAIGFLPTVASTARIELLTDRYLLLLGSNHPLAKRASANVVGTEELAQLDFVAVRSHGETLRILQALRLEHRVRLVASNFLALPALLRSTELAVLMPREIALNFEPRASFRLIEPGLPLRDFTVSLHWSRRHERLPLLRWTRALLLDLFCQLERPLA
ncbi:LysR substrate-binding domain-containing protein [Ideonella livida]|uniref:LysR family transcriptional regulator n=1 Tax=Ideonella livida TaxID=2707176 RepID=A0A7C9TPM6_9BURK|nr:LysR substrate-binding domain-containing protein [Ideonella livida]NDY94066.1 LysR family transcriptional regulator [Ideonella livida]